MTREEAIRRILAWNLDPDDMEVLSEVIPELESKDERIRKAIDEILKLDKAWQIAGNYGLTVVDIRKLLEKQEQKEQKQNPLEDYSRGYNDGYYHRITDSEQKEQKPNFDTHWENGSLICEQKPAEKQDYSGLNDLERAIHRGFLCAGVENVPVIIIKETAKECLTQMKPAELSEVELEFRGEKVKVKRPFFRDEKGRGYSTTEQDEDVSWSALRAWCEKKGISMYDLYPQAEWSDEDEEIIKFLEWLVGNHTWMGGVSRESVVRFLKELRPQPKQEWSEEEKDMVAFIVAMCDDGLKDCVKGSTAYRVYNEIKDWIIRPQFSWKPSERQLTKLYCIARGIPDDDDAKVLMELYEQLKKL